MLRPPTSPAAMLHLADTFEIDVSVVWTGHPLLVFAPTDPATTLRAGRSTATASTGS